MMLIELMQLPIFQEATIIAGKSGSSRPVHSVNMMDAPDIIDFLKPDELLITTAYAIKDLPGALEALVVSMSQCGCAGLAIKTKRFLSSIPTEVLEIANRLEFPIIELPLLHPLGEMLSQSLNLILEKQAGELKFALDTHQNFSRIVMKGKGLPEIIHALADLLHRPVLLLDQKYETLSSSNHFQTPIYKSLLPSIHEKLRQIRRTDHSTLPIAVSDNTGESVQELLVIPIQTIRHQGFLIVLNPPNDHSSLPKLAIEQAANVIGFEMMKRQAVKERSRRYKNEFFSELVEGVLHSDQEVMNRGRNYGLTTTNLSLCIVAKIDTPLPSTHDPHGNDNEEELYYHLDNLYDLLKKEFTLIGHRFVMFTKNELFVLIINLDKDHVFKESLLIKQLTDIQEQLHRTKTISLSFGIGNSVEHLIDIPTTYKQAVDALHSGYMAHQERFIQVYRAKDTIDLLRMLNFEELQEFLQISFRDLLNLDKRDRNELIRTMRVYLDHQCNIAETAKKLFVHRNTVIYRLDKCEQLTKRQLRDPFDSLRLRIACLIESLLNDS